MELRTRHRLLHLTLVGTHRASPTPHLTHLLIFVIRHYLALLSLIEERNTVNCISSSLLYLSFLYFYNLNTVLLNSFMVLSGNLFDNVALLNRILLAVRVRLIVVRVVLPFLKRLLLIASHLVFLYVIGLIPKLLSLWHLPWRLHPMLLAYSELLLLVWALSIMLDLDFLISWMIAVHIVNLNVLLTPFIYVSIAGIPWQFLNYELFLFRLCHAPIKHVNVFNDFALVVFGNDWPNEVLRIAFILVKSIPSCSHAVTNRWKVSVRLQVGAHPINAALS